MCIRPMMYTRYKRYLYSSDLTRGRNSLAVGGISDLVKIKDNV